MKNQIIVILILAFMLISTLPLSIPVEAITPKDYSYMQNQDFTMGNEYNNITLFESVALENINITTGNDNELKIHQGNNNYQPYGRFLRVNNLFYKYIINNDGDARILQSIDLLHYEERLVYLNGSLPIDLDDSVVTSITPFFFNNTYYVFYNNRTNDKLECAYGYSPSNFTDKRIIISSYFGGREIFPLNVYFINDYFYMLVINYTVIGTSYLELFKSNNLTNNWTLVPTFKNEYPTTGSSKMYSAKFYEFNNSLYFLSEEWDNPLSEVNTTFYKLNKTDIENYSKYNRIHTFISSDWVYTEYLPLGNTLLQFSFDKGFQDYYIFKYQSYLPRIYQDNSVINKIYPDLLIEYNNTNVNKSIELTNYLSFNPFNVNYQFSVNSSNNISTYYTYHSVNTNLFYLHTDYLEYNEEIYSKEIIKFKIFYPMYRQNTKTQTLNIYLNYDVYGVYNENWVSFSNTHKDYAEFNKQILFTPNGTQSFKRAIIAMRILNVNGEDINTSYDVIIYNNPSAWDNPLLFFFGQMTWSQFIGFAVLILGLIVLLFAIIKKDRNYIIFGFAFILTGAGLLDGAGILSGLI